jgi:predicted Zn-dependent peptidase
MIERHDFDNGLCLLMEPMPAVRSVSLGAWLTRGSRHEGADRAGIAHFVEHMLFKGTASRTAEAIAQEIDSIGGQLDAFTAKEYAGYYVKVLDEHLPRAVDLLSDLLLNPAFEGEEIRREQSVVLEEIKMVEDTPDDLVHEVFTANFWPGHPLGRPILGTAESVSAIDAPALREYFTGVYTAGNLIVSAAGSIDTAAVRDLIGEAFASLGAGGDSLRTSAPSVAARVEVRDKDLEQAHLCLGTRGYPQSHEDRYATYVLNTVLGGSMSSRLFQNIREKRGLAYAVSSGLTAYRDAGVLTVYVGCDGASVAEVVDLVVGELRGFRLTPMPAEELQRAKDHLKGSCVLGLESTTSRMSHLAQCEMYFGRQVPLSETLAGIESVTAGDVQRVAADLFGSGSLAATLVGPVAGASLSPSQLGFG